ncbi:Uncharacterised protein [Shigella sonnei]|nr:Uncharacterised protein [Shigella sonnei]
MLLQAGGQLRFTALVIQFAVSEFLFRLRQLRVQLLHLFFQTGNLFTQRLGLRTQLRFPTLLIFTCLGAVRVLFWRFVGLVFLLLYVAQPLLIIFQIAVERFDFTIVNQVEIVSGGTQQMTVVRNDNQRAFKLD